MGTAVGCGLYLVGSSSRIHPFAGHIVSEWLWHRLTLKATGSNLVGSEVGALVGDDEAVGSLVGTSDAEGARDGEFVGDGERDGAEASHRTLRWNTPSSSGVSADTTM